VLRLPMVTKPEGLPVRVAGLLTAPGQDMDSV